LTDVPRRPASAHVAHVVARADGGDDGMANLYASCAECNARLGTRTAVVQR